MPLPCPMVNLRACDSGACSAASNLSTASPATAAGSVRLNGAAAPPLPLLFSGRRIWSCGRNLRVEGEPRRMSRPKASSSSWISDALVVRLVVLESQWHAAGQALAVHLSVSCGRAVDANRSTAAGS